MLLYVSKYLQAFVFQDPQEMEWMRGMQEVFLIIFLTGLGVWAVAEFFALSGRLMRRLLLRKTKLTSSRCDQG